MKKPNQGLIAGVFVLAFAWNAFAVTTNTWIGAENGDWSVADNWDTQTVPAEGDIAVFETSATVTPAATFHGCVRNRGAGVLTVNIESDSEFSLALGDYDFSATGASFCKTGSGKLTLHAWPGMNRGKVTICEGDIAFAGNGTDAPGAFDKVEIDAGVNASVVNSPIASRFGYWYCVSKGSMSSEDLKTFRENGDAAVLVSRCEANAYVPSGNTSTEGCQALARESLAFDVAGCPTAAFTKVGNIDGVIFYYRGLALSENPGTYTHEYTVTHGNGIQGRYAIDNVVFKVNTKGAVSFAGQAFSHGWHALTLALRSDNRYGGGAPAAFKMARSDLSYPGDDGRLYGAKIWNGVCFNALKVASGARFALSDGAALAISNARRLQLDGTFVADTSNAWLYLASDWADGANVDPFSLSSLAAFCGTVDLGASVAVIPTEDAMPFTLVGEGRFITGEDIGTITVGRTMPLSVPVNELDRGSETVSYAMPSEPDWTFEGTARFSSHLAPNGTDMLVFRSPIPVVDDGKLVMTTDTGAQRSSVYLDGSPIKYDDEFRCSFTYHSWIKEEYAYAGKFGYWKDLPTYSLGVYLKPTSTADKTGSGWDYISLPPDVCGFMIGGWFASGSTSRGLWEVVDGKMVSGNPAVGEKALSSGDMFSPYDVSLYYKAGMLTIVLRQGAAETVRTLDVSEAFKKDGKVNLGFVGRTAWSDTSTGGAYGEAAWAWQEISDFGYSCVTSADALSAREVSLSTNRWAIFGAAQWSESGTSVAVLRNDSLGRGGCVLKEGIPVYSAFEFSADVYRGADAGYWDQGDNMFGLFVQAAGPNMTPQGGWDSRIGNVLPNSAQAFGGYVGAYFDHQCLFWVTNRVNSANVNEEASIRVAGTDYKTWSCVKNIPLRYTLAYDGLGTFTLTVVKDVSGNAVSSTYYYPQLGDRRYREDDVVKTFLYPSFLGTASSMGKCGAVIVSNVELKVQSDFSGVSKHIVRQVRTVADDTAEFQVGSVTGTLGDASEVHIDRMSLASGSTLDVVPYWEGESAFVDVDLLHVDSSASLVAEPGVRMDIRALSFTGERGEYQLQMHNGKVNFSTPLKITIPSAWLPLGSSDCTLVSFHDCELVKPIDTKAISVLTDTGLNVMSRFTISASEHGLVLRRRGFMVILY